MLQIGGLAQLGERLHGMQEVMGSSPLSSIFKMKADDHTRSSAFFVRCSVPKAHLEEFNQFPQIPTEGRQWRRWASFEGLFQGCLSQAVKFCQQNSAHRPVIQKRRQ